MNRFRSRLSVTALFAAAALFGPGCVAKEPGETDGETGAAALAVEEDLAAPDGAEVTVVGSPPADLGEAALPGQPAPQLCGSIWAELPPGTVTWKQPDGSAAYKLPPGYVSVETDPGTGVSAMVSGGSLTCKCQSGTGTCETSYRPGFVGCFVGAECSQCVTGGASAVLDLNASVGFANAEDVTSLPPVTPAILKVPMVANAFEQFRAQVAADAGLEGPGELDGPATGDLAGQHTFVSAPGWALAAVNVFGHVALISVPEGHAAQAALAWGSSQTCACKAGSGCTAGSMFGAKYCEAGDCTSCSMTLSVAAGDVTLMSVSDTMACGL